MRVPKNARLTVAGLLLWSAACGGDASGPSQQPKDVASVTLNLDAATITAAGRVQLTAVGKDAAGNTIANPNLTWSTNAAVATVTAQGLVTGVSIGTATITATATSARATTTAHATISVVEGTAGATTLDPGSATIFAGESRALKFASFDSNGLANSSAVTWTTTDASVVTVDANGRITGVAGGNANVRATAGSNTVSAAIVVMVPLVIAAITASKVDVCALTVPGALYCAGKNYGTTARPVMAPLRFKSIDGFGDPNTATSGFCAIATDDRAYCWGSNADGQLGVGDVQDRPDPTLVAGGLLFKHLSAGDYHTCAVTLAGAAYCWGEGLRGALGDGNNRVSNVPVRVATDVVFTQISAGSEFSCALSDAGQIYCWGRNGTGQLGNGQVPTDSNTPQAVAGNTRFKTLNQKNSFFACALTFDGEAYCWGNANPFVSLSAPDCPFDAGGTHKCYPVPTPLASGLRFKSLTANALGGMCSISTNDEVFCWGVELAQRFGQTGVTRNCLLGCGVPRQGPLGFVSVAGSVQTNCGLTAIGRAYCWGDNQYGQLTDASVTTSTSTPVIFRVIP